MASHLPPELLTHIALYLGEDHSSLTKCARVSQQWQPVFERLIYHTLKVESDDFPQEKGTISLLVLECLTSGPNQRRRSYVRYLEYTTFMPYNIRDYQAVKLEGYHEQNLIRAANDEAFGTAIRSLFKLLNSWGEEIKISLALVTQGRDETLEPETEMNEDADQWQGVMDGEQVVSPYRAHFPDGISMLPQVTCVDELLYERMYNPLWPGAMLEIAESCLTLQRLHLTLQDSVRPDHLEFMRERRQALAAGLARLPSTLQEFRCNCELEHPWSNILPALDLRPPNSKIDGLSSTLRLLSCNLRKLKISGMSLDMDFLFPLDDSGNPTSDASSLYWPYLESINLDSEWLLDYELSPEDAEDFPDPATGNQIFESRWLLEEDEVTRDKPKPEHFHRLFISLGYAARRMPCLKLINVFPVEWPRTELEFHGGSTATKQCLIFRSDSAYRRDQRVATAWGFSLDVMDVEDTWPLEDYHSVVCEVTLDRFAFDE
ncbi:hypothetical protein BDV12DRAFT_207144 [Aspergillus spectabilis]